MFFAEGVHEGRLFSLRIRIKLLRRFRGWSWPLVGRRCEDLVRDGRDDLLQRRGRGAQAILLQRAERLRLGGVVHHRRPVSARRPSGLVAISRLAGAPETLAGGVDGAGLVESATNLVFIFQEGQVDKETDISRVE